MSAFKQDVDADGDGTLSMDELSVAVRVRHRAADAASSTNPKVLVTENAWAKILYLAAQKGNDWKSTVDEMFNSLDDDGSGEIGPCCNWIPFVGLCII